LAGVATRLVHLLFNSADPLKSATFWAQALGWELVDEGQQVAAAEPAGFEYPGTSAVPLVFVPVPEPKTVKNRVHLDLTSTSPDDQAAKVERLLSLGATRIDIGQGEVPWVVLADPEGNEFCVLEPRPVYRDTGPVAAIVVDCVDPGAMSRFWTVAAGWPVTGSDGGMISLRSASGEGPFLELLRSAEPKQVKNRVHIDIAPFAEDDQAADVATLRAAGAKLADVGQSGSESWIVMSDPDGQEFCVLTPR
jgi:predicted enzyme related to lactoylglutathione lyase